MKFKLKEDGYSALVDHHIHYGLTNYHQTGWKVSAGDEVIVWSVMDRQFGMKGSHGIVKKIYYTRFWHYENCFVSVYLPNFDKAVWLDFDCLEIIGVNESWMKNSKVQSALMTASTSS